MNKIIKICVLSTCLLTQQNYAINTTLLVGAYFSTVTLVATWIGVTAQTKRDTAQNAQSTQIISENNKPTQTIKTIPTDEYQNINTEFDHALKTYDKAYIEHEQFLEDKFAPFSFSDKFLKYQQDITSKFNEAAEEKSIDRKKKNIASLKDLTDLYPSITDCLKTAIEELAVSDKTYDSCFEYALSEQEKTKD